METSLQLTTESPIELATVIQSSGLEVERAQGITNKYLPFLQKIAEIELQARKVDFENPTELDEKICRELRLQLVPNRTGCDKFKKAQKAEYALINGLNDNCYGIVEKTSKLLENKLESVEKARAIKAEAEKVRLTNERLELLAPYLENAAIYPLGGMSESAFNDLLAGSKLNAEQKAAALKAESEAKLAKELEDKAAAEKLRIENERLKKETEEKIAALKAEQEKAASAQRESDEKLKAVEAEKAKEKAEADAKLQAEIDERKKADGIAEQNKRMQEEKFKLDKNELEQKLAAAEAEMKKKKDEEAQAEFVRKKNEDIAKKAADAAAKAPDKEKLKAWVNEARIGITPDVGEAAHKLALEIHVKFGGFKKWANSQIDSL